MKHIAIELIRYITYLVAFCIWLIPVVMIIVMEG
jgi:hypothetical protein